ncbi:MAG: sialate O-acetylesterase [Armatimonadota bacterium]
MKFKFILSILLVFISAGLCSASINVTTPTVRAVYQRNSNNYAVIPITGTVINNISRMEARAVVVDNGSGKSTSWHRIAGGMKGGQFSGSLTVPAGGWYRIEIRAFEAKTVISTAAVDKVGVGEVFVTTGQSNSTNFGNPRMTPQEDRVSAWGRNGWQFAADPQPIASDDGAQGGSPWPILGDILVRKLNVPVGFVSVGWGGSAVSQWNSEGTFYPRMKLALQFLGKNGERAILWHQGETDMVLGTSTDLYMKLLGTLIDQSRTDAGWDVPWVIAGVSFMPSASFGAGLRPKMTAIRNAQRDICDNKTIFQGPTTDDIVGSEWRSDTVHFNSKGLHEHAKRWADVLMHTFFTEEK